MKSVPKLARHLKTHHSKRSWSSGSICTQKEVKAAERSYLNHSQQRQPCPQPWGVESREWLPHTKQKANRTRGVCCKRLHTQQLVVGMVFQTWHVETQEILCGEVQMYWEIWKKNPGQNVHSCIQNNKKEFSTSQPCGESHVYKFRRRACKHKVV